MSPKSKILQKFQKPEKNVRELPLSSHHAKFQINIFNFDPQMAVIYVKSDDVIFSIAFF